MLSPIGELVLACEEHGVGSVPIGLVDGGLYRGGKQPPLDPARALRTIAAVLEDETIPDGDLERMIGLPSLPTSGTVQGDIQGLYAGRDARLLQSYRIMREFTPPLQALVITGTPLGVPTDQIIPNLRDRAEAEKMMEQRRLGNDPGHGISPEWLDWLAAQPSPIGLRDVRDETSGRTGTRLVIVADPGADLETLEGWVRGVWPVTIETSCRFPGGIGAVLRTWADACRVGRSGLDKLTALMS